MAKYKYNIEPEQSLLEERKSLYGLRTYISLFSSAGVGCYGFKQENYHCIATVELLERRLKVQEYNNKCIYPQGYICGDMTSHKDKWFETIELAKADTIDKSMRKFGERYYRKESFLYVIKVGLSQEQEWPMSLSFADIKHQLIMVYNSVA